MSSIFDNIDVETLMNLVSKSCMIKVVDNGLEFTDDSGDTITCPNFSANIADDDAWLSSKIPDLGFDVEQCGNLRKAEEAESIYLCIVIVLILKDELFKNELEDVINNYDYISMSGLKGAKNFKGLLTEWQDLQSTLISVCVSAGKFKISSVKKDTEKFLHDGIPENSLPVYYHL